MKFSRVLRTLDRRRDFLTVRLEAFEGEPTGAYHYLLAKKNALDVAIRLVEEQLLLEALDAQAA